MEQGAVIWICGLAGSGKSTIASALYKELKKDIPHIVHLDGDEIRDLLGFCGYDRQGRIKIALKYSKLAHFLSSQGIFVIVSTISLFNEIYTHNRETLKNYREIFIQCPKEELYRRDQKQLYSKALKDEIQNVVGVDIAFDEPKPHIVVDNHKQDNLQGKVADIIKQLNLKI